MTGLGFTFRRIDWAESKDNKLPTRLLLLKDGDVGWADLEDVKLDKDQAEAIISHFKKQGADLPIDYHHSTVKIEEHPERVTQGATAPAVGWIKGLEYVEGEGLFADPVEWTDPDAVAAILAERYKYFSPVILTDKKTNAIVALHSVALTNKPRTKAQKELLEAAEQWSQREEDFAMTKFDTLKANALGLAKALRIEVAQEEEIPEFPAVDKSQQAMARLLDLLQEKGADLADDSPLAAVLEAAIVMLKGGSEEEPETAPTEEEEAAQKTVDAVAAELNVAAKDHKALTAELAVLKVKAARHDELDKQVAELVAERKAGRVKVLIGEAVESGKLNPHDDKAMESARALAGQDEDAFRNLFAGMAPVVEPGQQVTSTGGKRGALIAEASKEYEANPNVGQGARKESYVAAALAEEGMDTLTTAELATIKGGE